MNPALRDHAIGCGGHASPRRPRDTDNVTDSKPGTSPLLHCAQALRLVADHAHATVPPGPPVQVPLDAALNRVLAQPLHADRDQPPFDRSTRDGYAVRGEVGQQPLHLIGSIRAGEQWTGPALQPGQAIEIMTGAPIPQGADAVRMLEHVDRGENTVKPLPDKPLRPGENIVPRAAEACAGDLVLPAGTRLGAAELALAASIGAATLQVWPQPIVAILSTGDELVGVADTPGPMQIRNSNSHCLAALVRSNGGDPHTLPPVADTREALEQAIASVRSTPLLLLSGGVSAGKYDLVEEVLLNMGAQFFFTGVKIQPGKPAVFGRIPAIGNLPAQWIFGLPGNPVSTQVTATLFAMPMLRALAGETAPAPVFANATLTEAVAVRPGLTRFLPAHMQSTLEGATVRPTGWQGSGDLHSNARANCYLVVPPTAETLPAGANVTLLLR